MTISNAIRAIAMIAASSAAVAQVQPGTTGKDVLVKGKKNPDPNRLICRTNDAIGSRLRREQRCFTSSEWEELRQLDRRAIDRIQANRYSGQ